MTQLAFYFMRCFYKGKLIEPLNFMDWLYCSPIMRKVWLTLFGVFFGIFLPFAIRQPDLFGLLLICCGCCIFIYWTEVPTLNTKIVEIIKKEIVTKTVEKTIEKPVPMQSKPIKHGIIYILRREDGVLKFGKTYNLKTRLAQHRDDYHKEFVAVSSWVVPNVSKFEDLALDMTKPFQFTEGNRRELRQMTDLQLSDFILKFTNKIQRGLTNEPQ